MKSWNIQESLKASFLQHQPSGHRSKPLQNGIVKPPAPTAGSGQGGAPEPHGPPDLPLQTSRSSMAQQLMVVQQLNCQDLASSRNPVKITIISSRFKDVYFFSANIFFSCNNFCKNVFLKQPVFFVFVSPRWLHQSHPRSWASKWHVLLLRRQHSWRPRPQSGHLSSPSPGLRRLVLPVQPRVIKRIHKANKNIRVYRY